jgi:MFS transporter, MHS family, proline/betaine transporter
VPILRLASVVSVTAVAFYMFTTYLTTYLQVSGGMRADQALLVSVISLGVAIVLCPICGIYSDAVGRRATIATVCVLLAAGVYPAYLLAGTGVFAYGVLAGCLIGVGTVMAGIVVVPLLVEVFPTRTRYTASSIAYNAAYTIFGGTAPLVATLLITQTGNKTSPAFYLMCIAAVGLIGGLGLPERSRVPLDQIDDEADGLMLSGSQLVADSQRS